MLTFPRFFARTPKVTRLILLSTIIISSSCVLGVLSPSIILLSWPSIRDDWQIWRLVTALFYTNMSQLSGLMDIYALYSFSKGIEEGKFFHNAADYAFYLFLVIPLIQASWVLLDSPSLLLPLLSALTYTWSRANRFSQVMVYFIKIQAEYLPLAMLIFTFLLFGKELFFSALSGLCAAYFYQCLESKTLGPVYAWICSTLGVDTSRTGQTQRVGTIHTMNQTEGPLKAPRWFANIVDSFVRDAPLGRSTKGNAGARIGGFNTMPQRDQSTYGTSSGYSFSGSAFRGSGHRLGGTE